MTLTFGSEETCPKMAIGTRFNLSAISVGIVTNLLITEYMNLVEKRGHKFRFTDGLPSNFDKVAKWITSERSKPWLVLNGGVGTGKTTMARATLGTIWSIKRRARQEAKSIHWRKDRSLLTEEDILWLGWEFLPCGLFVEAQKVVDLANDDTEASKFDTLKHDGILVLDELGTEPTITNHYGTKETPVVELIYARYRECAPLIITTNLNPDRILEIYGERVADRLEEMCDWIGFNDDSFRASWNGSEDAVAEMESEGCPQPSVTPLRE